MVQSETVKDVSRRLLLSRMRILCDYGFYGLLIMHMIFSIDEKCENVATDGNRVFFNPEFIMKLSDTELDFVLMHEILHAALLHCDRKGDRRTDKFDEACDIVVNSTILSESGFQFLKNGSKNLGKLPHKAPDGREGKNFTAEEMYDLLYVIELQNEKRDKEDKKQSKKSTNKEQDEKGDKKEQKNSSKNGNQEQNEGSGQGAGKGSGEKGESGGNHRGAFDDHSRWSENEDGSMRKEEWKARLCNAREAIRVRESAQNRGLVPLLAERCIEELKEPVIDWRSVLNEFIQEEVCDYSFFPPDRRFHESPFFLPDFNEKDETVRDILFMVDTSGSMTDSMIGEAYVEIKGAIEQFSGKLCGYLGFFDAYVVPPEPFENEDEFKIIRPKGGGGTDFCVIFDYVRNKMNEKKPVSIIVFTDGYAPFPPQEASCGIPVLWLINNKSVTPPWGKVARMLAERD